MREDSTPTHPLPIDVIAAQLEAFRKDPTDRELYTELRMALRTSGQPELLAELCELRAPLEHEPMAAADMLSEAGAARLLVGDDLLGERDLREALRLDPCNERAAARLTERLMVSERFAEAATVMEHELDGLDARATTQQTDSGHAPLAARRAQRHRMLAELWDQRLGRVDRALVHWQRAWQLEPERPEAIEAAREIYAGLGDDAMVARLYVAELEAVGDKAPPERLARLELELGRLVARGGDATEAAEHLERAVALDPRSSETREALAEVYASPAFVGHAAQQQRAGELFVELGRDRLRTEDREGAIGYLRRALGVDPFSRSGTENLEEALVLDQRWDELDRLYRHQTDLHEDLEERLALLRKRALLYEDRLEDREALVACLEELALHEPPGGEASTRLRALYREDQAWRSLTALLEREIDAIDDPEQQAHELLELATVTKEHLGDRDRAAEHLHRILSLDPRNEEALARYHDHFRERRDWRGLADLTEFSIDNFYESGAPTEPIVRQLEELARLAELRLGDVDRAANAWTRIAELEPANPKAREALRRLASRAKMWQSLVGVLEDEAAQADGASARAEALRRIAQVYRERQVNPRRAIQLYEEVLQAFPQDEPALKALAELYEREGDDAGLARTLRRQLDIEYQRVAATLAAEKGRAATAREWPVAQRVERLTTLRRLATMYEQRLADVEGVVFAATGILEILPGDRDALDRMERVLDKAGDLERLEQTLEYHAEAAAGPAERAKVLRRLARIARDRNDELAAMERCERVLRVAPNDGEALTTLAELYERHGRFKELATVLERRLAAAKMPPPGTPAAAERALELQTFARVVDEHLGDTAKATRAWHQLLVVQPKDREALEALARLHATRGEWRDLAEVLERQAPLYLNEDPAVASDVALRRARLLEERLGAPGEAIAALEDLLRDVDPANLDAHKSLRRLYEARGDFEAAVRIAEREMYLADEGDEKIARGLEIGLLCRDQIGDPMRALQAFERALELAPDLDEARVAAAELYAQVGDWRQHIVTLEQLVPRVQAGRERRALLLRIAHATAERLHDYEGAFTWLRLAHEHAPDATTIAELRRAAEAYALWAQLCDVYDDERRLLAGAGTHLADPRAYLAACREVAAIAERRLDDRPRAMKALDDAIRAAATTDGLLAEAERIALEADDPELWRMLLECMVAPLEVADREGRVALHVRRAHIYEERLDDAKAAEQELLRAFALAPERGETRDALYAMAERTRRWSNVVAVEAALYARATALAERIGILRRKAQVSEDHMRERVHAFRTHLRAFLLAPEDSDTVAHLWRLGRLIGNYPAAERTPQPEPPAAHVEPTEPESPRTRRGSATRNLRAAIRIEPTHERREATQELSASDLLFGTEETALAPQRGDPTIELDISDLQPTRRPDPTIELKTEDLIEALRDGNPPPSPEREREARPLPGVRGYGQPPPPPPRPPQIRRQAPRAGAGRATTHWPTSLTAEPHLPSRPYVSAWDEFASAYEVLPAPDRAARLRWLFRGAEVWESGAEDLDRAFDTLHKALELAPDDAEPRARLHRLAREHGQWDKLAGLYETAATHASTPATAAALYLEVAAIRTEQGNPQQSELLYRRVLGMRPDDAAAREKLEELYRADERWVDLAASLEERTDPRLGAAAPENERPALLRELAGIYSEQLERPHDALDALRRLRSFAPEDLEVLQQIASINESIGRWSQVIEALHRVAEVAEGRPEGREAQRRVGDIYRRELELPDRAIDAYRELVETAPDDQAGWAALDQLYEEHARWPDLSEALRRRAALAPDSADRARLLQRRARVLMEWLGQPDEAASALRHARTIAPDGDSLADDLIQALTKAGREREAAGVLEGRVAAMTGAGAAAGDIAAQLIRLASVRADRLEDRPGAKEALERALALVPDHPTALSVLARLAESDADPRAYAEARLREADALHDASARVDALLDAGHTLRDRCGDDAAARAAFSRALELAPGNAAATWALAGLIEDGGGLDAAAALLEQRLEDDSLAIEERAAILTQLAALARRAGVDAAAERRLEEALRVEPAHLPAIIAKADLLRSMARHSALETFLTETIPHLADAAPQVRAEIDRRLAEAYEALGRDDEAYQILLEADRTHRRDLLVKLALGENRYRARRWREAALHLGALAEHPDAARHAAEVAAGLYHAALAEIRALRPAKAEPLYRRALALKPNFAPALRALAELAMERGNASEAADLLTRQATATDDHPERMRLFESLGDLALMTLRDEHRAKLCYEAAVAAADPLESSHVPLLEKLLERQDLASDHLGAARTAELMASFGDTPSARAQRYTAAAQGYLAGGDAERARAAAERAVEAAPHDLTGVTNASELLMRDHAYEQVAQMLDRALSAGAPQAAYTRDRAADLWHRLGQARRALGDVKGAGTAHERAIETAPTSPASLAARRELLDLWDDDDARRQESLVFARTVARADRRPAEILHLGRMLARGTEAGPVHADGARVAIELAATLGEELSGDDVAFLGRHPERELAFDESYGGAIDQAAHESLIADECDSPMAEILRAVWDSAPLLWSEVDDALERLGLISGERITSKTDIAAAVAWPHIGRALDTPRTVLYRAGSDDAPDAQVVCASPPVVVLGPRLWVTRQQMREDVDGDRPGDLELRFLLGRAAELARPERIIAVGLPPDEFASLIASLVRVFGVHPQPDDTVADALRERDELLKTTLPVKVRQRIKAIIENADAAELSPDRYLDACRRAADRAGLLVCGDVATAMRLAGGTEGTEHLIGLALDPRYLDARAALGIGVAGT